MLISRTMAMYAVVFAALLVVAAGVDTRLSTVTLSSLEMIVLEPPYQPGGATDKTVARTECHWVEIPDPGMGG